MWPVDADLSPEHARVRRVGIAESIEELDAGRALGIGDVEIRELHETGQTAESSGLGPSEISPDEMRLGQVRVQAGDELTVDGDVSRRMVADTVVIGIVEVETSRHAAS